jgi:hypothetical protein
MFARTARQQIIDTVAETTSHGCRTTVLLNRNLICLPLN